MPQPVRIAVAGAGLIGRAHVARILASPDAALAGIADPSPEGAALAAAHGVPHAPGMAAILAAARPDAAIAATPNRRHVPDALACLDAGIPCLVEKPVADTVEDAERLVDAAARTGIPVQVGHHHRHSAFLRGAAEIVASGRLGRIVAVNALTWFRKPDDYFGGPGAWRTKPGGGPILINLIHLVDDLRTLCGDVESVTALTSNATRGFDVEDTAAILLRFRNGALGTVNISDAAASPWSWELTSGENPAYPRTDEACTLIAGTAASLSIPRLEVWSHGEGGHWWTPIHRDRRTTPDADPLTAQLAHFVRVVRGEAAPYPDAAEGLATLRTTLAVTRSAGSGVTVTP